MADTFYGVTLGLNLEPGAAAGGSAVVKAAATTGAAIEFRTTDATAGITGKKDVVLAALDKLKAFILEDVTPL